MKQIIFYFFSFFALFMALFLILTKNSIHAVLSLIFTFILTSIIWLILEAEFLAMTLILVYVGAVMVLFLFVVMMLDIEEVIKKSKFVKLWPFVIFIPMFLFLLTFYTYNHDSSSVTINSILIQHSVDYNNMRELGTLLYTRYLFSFEIAGLLLLVGIIAAISLTFRGKVGNSHYQNIRKQINVSSKNRLKLKN